MNFELFFDDYFLKSALEFERKPENHNIQRPKIHPATLKLNFHENKKAVATASLAQIRKPIYRSSVKNWENHVENLTVSTESEIEI